MSAADVAAALNAVPASGVTAAAVRTGSGDPPTWTLQLTGTTTGAANGFSVHLDDATAAGPGLALTEVRAASDARITLFAGSPAEQALTSSSNTFTGLMSGVDVTVRSVTADPVTLTVARDEAALTSLASGLVGALGVVLSEIASRTATTTTTGSDGSSVVSGGLFAGDSAVRALQQQLQSAASYPVDGTSPSTVGITIGVDGTFTFDSATFAAALAKDPAKVQAVVTGLAERVADVATSTSDKIDGSLTLKIQGQQGVVKDLGTQIENWDVRLALRRASLERTYSALEVTLSGLQSQSSWLSSQLASLSTSS